jgi:hypothetical protein
MARIAELGCIACSLDGIPGTPAEVHHIRHQGGRFKMLYGDELDLLNLTLERFYD